MTRRFLIAAAAALCLIGAGSSRAGSLSGDANGDGAVDLDDFVILKNHFGTPSGATVAEGDFDGDGDVDLDDFVVLKTHFGAVQPQVEELLVNGDFEIGYGSSSQLGADVAFPVTVGDDPTGAWEAVCVGDWVRGGLGNWQDPPNPTGNDSRLAAVVRKPVGTLQATGKGAVRSGDTLTLTWDYHTVAGLVVGPTFTFRLFGVNEAGSGQAPTQFANGSTTVNSPTTVTGEPGNFREIGNVSLAVAADDPTNGTWRTAAPSTFLVGEDWDYIVLIFGRSAGDNNISGNEIDNISLAVTRGDGPLNRSPRADAGTDQTVADLDGDGSEPVTLDGSASSDADGTIVDYAWDENGTAVGAGAGPTVALAVGSHVITLTVTDDDGATDADTVAVDVEGPPPADPLYPGPAWDGTAGSGYAAEPVESTTPLGAGTAQAIARWDVVPRQIIDRDFAVGVVAFHHEGIARVEFLCEGNQVEATEMTLNPRTGVTEYTAVLDVSAFDNGTSGDGAVKLYARVIPASGYERLISLDLFCNVDGTLFGGDVGRIIYVDGTGGDDSRSLAEAQNPATPVRTLVTAMNRAAGLAPDGNYGGNGVIIEVLTPGFYPFNRPSSNYAASWITVRPAAGLTRQDVVIGAAGNETEWPSLNFKAPVKFENITFDLSYLSSMSSHWAENCLYTDAYGAWHAGGGGTWDAETRTLTAGKLLSGYDHAYRAARGQNYLRIRGGDGVTPGIYEIASKVGDDAIVLVESCSPVDGSVSWGRGHDILRTDNTAYAINCDFIDMGSGPSKYALVRGCLADTMSGDFMQEWQFVVNTEVRNFHGEWDGAMHSDIFQRVGGAENCILYGVKATGVDNQTQLLFFENSTSTIGGDGRHDNWAMVNCLFVAACDVYEPPYAQFCRPNHHVVMVNNAFLGQATAFRGGDSDEAFVPVNGLIANNIFHRLHFTEANLAQAVVDNNHYITNTTLPGGDLRATSGSTLAGLFADPAGGDYTPLPPVLAGRTPPWTPTDLYGTLRSDPTAVGPIEESREIGR
ncbi:MAG: hypothetical protein GX591_02060 [Planctomycetes bacterium]|nr:hypothetical protein [Planctomycetota bacterium]